MNRETKTITTPIGQDKVELYTYVTGREKRALTNLFLNANFDFDTEAGKVKNLDYKVIDIAQDLAFTTVVVSINDNKENILTTLLDMRDEDMKFIVAEVNKVTNGPLTEEKKTI